MFLERGFHGASLEEISARAGYSTGAVYSNFESKDDLFLAVIDERSAGRVRDFSQHILDESLSFEDALRVAARRSLRAARETPRWIPVLTEFWIHVDGRSDGVRTAAAERHHSTMDALAELIQELADRHGIELSMPARGAARATSALVRGIELERVLDPKVGDDSLFEEMWIAFMMGISRPKEHS